PELFRDCADGDAFPAWELGLLCFKRKTISFSRSVAAVDGKVAADNSIMTAATASGASLPTHTPTASTRLAADLHCPVATATGGRGGRTGWPPAKHLVRGVWGRLHQNSPCTSLGIAADGDFCGDSARRSAAFHETRVIETVAASHVMGMLLSERV